jgi:hypothetical protein
MRHPLRFSVAACALAALAAAPAANASLPNPKSTLIKPGSSIGGVKYGMDAQQALKLWGKGSNCDEAAVGRCTWAGSAKQGSAYFEVGRDGKVAEVGLQIGQKSNGVPIYKGPLTKWKDAKGIGLGSTQSATAKAYKKAFPNGGGLQLNSGSRATIWTSSLGRDELIAIGSKALFSQ